LRLTDDVVDELSDVGEAGFDHVADSLHLCVVDLDAEQVVEDRLVARDAA